MLHLFVANEKTFKLHLEYLFAGVGKGRELSPFLYKPDVSFNGTRERNIISMLSDISRIREGDKIAFYLQNHHSREGKIFGIFTATSRGFFDENDEGNFLIKELNRGLSNRIFIQGWKVFSKGIRERDLLDDISNKKSPWELLWSLIYRKWNGNRRCTMLTEHEEEELIKQLSRVNQDQCLEGSNFSFDTSKEEIIISSEKKEYLGRKDKCDVKSRLIHKMQKRLAFEDFLKAYILQNFDSLELKNILFPLPSEEYWIGNEVAYEPDILQGIDLLIKQEDEKSIFIKIIEIEDERSKFEVLEPQFSWYIKWVLWYIVPYYSKINPDKRIIIIPCVIAPDTNLSEYKAFFREQINTKNSKIEISDLEVIDFKLEEDSLIFRKATFS